MTLLHELKDSLLHLFFPHCCAGCGADIPDTTSMLCLRCIHAIPETHFEKYPGNPVEKIFWGRLPLEAAAAPYYFTRESLMQRLMHQFKYRGHADLGFQLGRMMGRLLSASNRFAADALIPLPLYPDKEKKRGFNQATLLCRGMAEVMQLPVLENCVSRPRATETQTRKGRIERWKNIEGKFVLNRPELIHGKTVMLVDDVVTTGATLEACGSALLSAGNLVLKIAALSVASR